MESVIAYFETIPSSHRALILAGGIALFWLIENAFPLFQLKYDKWRHFGLNLFFTFTTIIVNFLLAFLLLRTADWAATNRFGLLYVLPEMPDWLFALTGLLLLDLIGAWLAHFVQHRIPMLWRFHLIHHSDTWIDTTSANRHHPGESVIRFAFTVLAVVVSGSPMWLVFLYQSLSVVFSQFSHANLNLPPMLDKALSWIIVSPNMHKVHHHYKLPYTDSNYGNIFSVWDRLFRTFLVLEPKEIRYGIDTYPNENDHNKLGRLLRLPFTKIIKTKHLHD